MKMSISQKDLFLPLPVLVIGTYDNEGKANVMTAAWGTLHDYGEVFLCLSSGHLTTKNIHKTNSFTVSFATKDTIIKADYYGIVSGKSEDKILKTQLTVKTSNNVNAPLFDEFPVTLECKVKKIDDDGQTAYVVGEIVGIQADKDVLTNNKIDFAKLNLVVFNSAENSYHVVGDKIADAFSIGKKVNHE